MFTTERLTSLLHKNDCVLVRSGERALPDFVQEIASPFRGSQ